MLDLYTDDQRVEQPGIGLFAEQSGVPHPQPGLSGIVERLVERILSAKRRDLGLRSEASSSQAGADVRALERELDGLAYALYGLAPEEINIVEDAGH